MVFRINGEYGYELFAAVPLVNWYKEQGNDVEVYSSIGAGLLYPNIKVNEIYKQRVQFLHLEIDDELYYKQFDHVAGVFSKPVVGDKLMWEDKWSPPDLKSHYKTKFNWVSLNFDKPLLIISNWLYLPVIIGISVMIGTNFTPDILKTAQQWTFSVSIMLIATLFVTFIAFQFLTRVKFYEPKQAFLCSIPGGQAEAVVMAREIVEKDYVVALFHLIRVAIVFISTPFLLAFIGGNLAIKQSNEILYEMPNLVDLSLSQIIIFLFLCFSGYWIGKLIRLPIPHLLGPIFLSSILHLAGIIELPRISELIIIAQMTIGASVGARLAQVSLFELRTTLVDACLTSGLILITYLFMAIFIVFA